MSKVSLRSVHEALLPDRTSSSARASIPTKASTPIKRPFTGTGNPKIEIRRFSLGSDKVLNGLNSRRNSLVTRSQVSLIEKSKEKEEPRKASPPKEETVPLRVAVRVRPFIGFKSFVR